MLFTISNLKWHYWLVSSQQLRFEITKMKRKFSWIGFLLEQWISPGQEVDEAPIRAYPEIAVYNVSGQRQVLAVTGTEQEARDQLATIEEDLNTLPIHQWCDRYNVPFTFVGE